MNIKTLVTTLLVSAVLATGCAPQNVNTGTGGTVGGGSGSTGGAGNNGYNNGGYNNGGNGYNNGGYNNGAGGNYTLNDLRNPSSILSQRIIYFDLDRADIKPEYMNVLNAHASLLAANPSLRVRLEGHADERGSREYNVALSERRGYSVLDYMQIKSARSTQMDVIGYGEEIPATFGHNEAAWGKNRRVEIKYPGE